MTRLGRSAEENVGCSDQLDRSVIAHQTERSVGVQPAETATQNLVLRDMDRQPGSDVVGAMFPCPHERCTLRLAPEVQQPGKASGEERSKGLRHDLDREPRGFTIVKRRSAREIDAEADRDAISAPLEQDAGELLPAEHQVVRPFEHERFAGRRDVERLDQREPRRQGERRRRRVIRPELDERAPVEIAVGGDPLASLPAPARFLFERDEPFAFDGSLRSEQVRIGRANALDDPDAAQKIDPAARSVIEPSRPIRR